MRVERVQRGIVGPAVRYPASTCWAGQALPATSQRQLHLRFLGKGPCPGSDVESQTQAASNVRSPGRSLATHECGSFLESPFAVAFYPEHVYSSRSHRRALGVARDTSRGSACRWRRVGRNTACQTAPHDHHLESESSELGGEIFGGRRRRALCVRLVVRL